MTYNMIDVFKKDYDKYSIFIILRLILPFCLLSRYVHNGVFEQNILRPTCVLLALHYTERSPSLIMCFSILNCLFSVSERIAFTVRCAVSSPLERSDPLVLLITLVE